MRWRSFLRRRKKASDGSAQADPDIVILIHGTGASEPDPVTPKWWQTESAYAKDLRDRLGPGFDVGTSELSAPFKWSGANSEKDRRRAGRKLATRLRKLERDGRSYHLVGHSHGGSVIWHALWQSNGRLPGLKSWTSVGTPFLEFSPVWMGITTLVTLVVVALLTYGPALQLFDVLKERAIILRDGSPLGVFTTVVLCVILLLLFLGLAVAAIRWLVRHFLHWRQRRKEKNAVEAFADRWLAVWHKEDEPIAGLNASLISPLEFVPRLAKPTSNWFWRVLTSPFNRVVAPVTDQFVWTVLMRRLQGADIGGCVMVDAGSAPGALGPGWQSMPKDLASDMVTSAGNQAPRTIESLRKRLAEMRGQGSGQEAFGQLSSAITWSEILHTSYFDINSVRGLIADRIEQSAASTDSSPSIKDSQHFAWLTERPKAEPPQWPKPFQPVLLNFAKIAVFGGLAMLLFTGFKAAYDAYVAPHTLDGQLNLLAQNAVSREAMSGANVGLVGEILVRLDTLGKLGDPTRVVRRIPDIQTRAWAGQRLAYHYALNGKYAPIEIMARDAEDLDVLKPADAVGFVYVHALVGAREAAETTGKSGEAIVAPSTAFLDEAARKLFIAGYDPADVDKVSVFDPRQNLGYVWLVPALDALEHFKHQPSMAAAKQRIEQVVNGDWLKPESFEKTSASEQVENCLLVASLKTRFDESNLPPNLAAAYKHCSTAPSIPPRAADISVPEPLPALACPTDAELDIPSPRVGELHFTWKQSLPRIKDLLKRNCNDAAIAAVRRHIPDPVGDYETAEFGWQLVELAKQLESVNAATAVEVAKYNLKWSPAAIASLNLGPGRPSISSAVCLNQCSDDELRSFAKAYLNATRKDPVVPDNSKKIDLANYRISDRTTYRLAAATIFIQLGDRSKAVDALREALFSVYGVPRESRHEVAFKIGNYAYPLDQELGLQAYARASYEVYGLNQSGDSAATASLLHMRLAREYFKLGEYRLAREAAERAQDRLSVVAAQNESNASELEKVGMGDGRATLAVYENILADAIRKVRPTFSDQLRKRGPRFLGLARAQ